MIETYFARTSTHRLGFAAGPWVLTSMRLPVHCASKGMLGTASDGICEAAISSRGGCVSTGTPSPRSLPRSSNRYVSGLPRSPAGKLPPACRGALASPHPLASATPASRPARGRASDGSGPMAPALCAVFGAGLRDRRQHPSALCAHGPAFPGRRVLGPAASIGTPCRRTTSLTLSGTKRRPNTVEGANSPVPRSAPCCASSCSVGTSPRVGSRGADPASVDPCHAPSALNRRRRRTRPGPVRRRDAGGVTQSRHLDGACPPGITRP